MAIFAKAPCHPCCGSGPTIGTITCVGRTGIGYMGGYARFIDIATADINRRVFKRAALLGSWDECEYSTSACSTLASGQWAHIAVSGEAVYDPAMESVVEEAPLLGTGYSGVSACGVTLGAETYPISGSLRFTASPWYGPPIPTTPYAAAYSSQTCTPIPPYRSFTGSLSIALSDPDTAFDAITRAGGYVEGVGACRTTALAASGFTEEYLTGGSVWVDSRRALIPITGLTSGTDYAVTVKINRYTAGGGSYLDFVYDTIEFTAGASTEDIEYDVPVNSDYDYEIDTSYKDIAAA